MGVVTLGLTVAVMVPWEKLWAWWRIHDEYQRNTKVADRRATTDVWLAASSVPNPNRPEAPYAGCFLQLPFIAGAVLTGAIWWNSAMVFPGSWDRLLGVLLGEYTWSVTVMTLFPALVATRDSSIRIKRVWVLVPGLALLGLLGGIAEWLVDYDRISASLLLMVASAWVSNMWVMRAVGREVRLYRDLRD